MKITFYLFDIINFLKIIENSSFALNNKINLSKKLTHLHF